MARFRRQGRQLVVGQVQPREEGEQFKTGRQLGQPVAAQVQIFQLVEPGQRGQGRQLTVLHIQELKCGELPQFLHSAQPSQFGRQFPRDTDVREMIHGPISVGAQPIQVCCAAAVIHPRTQLPELRFQLLDRFENIQPPPQCRTENVQHRQLFQSRVGSMASTVVHHHRMGDSFQ